MLQPRVARGARGDGKGFLGRFGLVLALTIGTLLLPTPERAVPGRTARSGLVCVHGQHPGSGTSLSPDCCSAGTSGHGCPGDGRQQSRHLRPFPGQLVFLILASLFLAEALRKHGLTRPPGPDGRFSLRLGGGGVSALLLGMMGLAPLFRCGRGARPQAGGFPHPCGNRRF